MTWTREIKTKKSLIFMLGIQQILLPPSRLRKYTVNKRFLPHAQRTPSR